jgi:hypothetical protein
MKMRSALLALASLTIASSVMLASPAMAGKLNDTNSGTWSFGLAPFSDTVLVYPQADKVTMDGTWNAISFNGVTINGFKEALPKGINPNSGKAGQAWSFNAGTLAHDQGNTNWILNVDIVHGTWNLFGDQGSGLALFNSGTLSNVTWTPGTPTPPASLPPPSGKPGSGATEAKSAE